MGVVKEGRCSLGICYIEDHGSYFMVHIGSSSVYGPYNNFGDALAKFREFCLD